MRVTWMQLVVVAVAYGFIRAGVSIYQEDKARLVEVEQAIKELKGSK